MRGQLGHLLSHRLHPDLSRGPRPAFYCLWDLGALHLLVPPVCPGVLTLRTPGLMPHMQWPLSKRCDPAPVDLQTPSPPDYMPHFCCWHSKPPQARPDLVFVRGTLAEASRVLAPAGC